MPLDILGRTRATMACAESLFEFRPRMASCLVQARATLFGSVTKWPR